MKKTFFALALLAATAAISTTAQAQDMRKASEYLRTLFAPVGQQKLALEAPDGMCFFDRSKGVEGLIVTVLSASSFKSKDGALLAVFAPCEDIANFGPGRSPALFGTITWLNQTIGDRTPLERVDYIDMREAAYKDDLQADVAEYLADKEKEEAKDKSGIKTVINFDFEDAVERSDSGVRMGYVASRDRGGEKGSTSGVVATTSIRHVPLEISINYDTTEKPHALAEIHLEMEKFLAKQIALNE